MGRLPSNLRVGLGMLAALLALAILAPLLATDRPWLTRGADGLAAPAFADWIGLGAQPVAGARPILRAPIPHDPRRPHLEAVLAPPGAGYWLGTDVLGRDMAARLVHGTRVSLAVGLLAALFALVIGLPLGALAGYFGGWTDAVVSRLIEAILCFPSLLLVLAVVASGPGWLLRLPDVPQIALVLGLTGWTVVARYLRGEFIKLRRSEMVAAAEAMGGGHLRIATRYILPSSLAPVLVTAAFAVGGAIATEAALSFFGLGVRPPVATWGGLLAEAREEVDRAWWLALFPGLALFLAVLACNLVGEGIRAWLDPRHRRP